MEAKKAPTSSYFRKRVRVLVEIECNEELFPGFGYNPHDFAEAVARAGERTLQSYDPKVITTGWKPVENAQPERKDAL